MYFVKLNSILAGQSSNFVKSNCNNYTVLWNLPQYLICTFVLLLLILLAFVTPFFYLL